MSEELIKTGDLVLFDPSSFSGLVFIPPVIPPIPIGGTGSHTVMNLKACVEGDEKKVMMGAGFMKPPGYPVPGAGMFTIKKLNKDQLSKKTKCDGKKLIRKGTKFDAVFTVMSPPMQLPPPASGGLPDTSKFEYKGKGQFQTMNTTVKDAS